MSEAGKPRRFALAIELAICTVLVALITLNAMRRMDYLSADTAQHIRVTDESRTALVARNIVEGDGYTTNDLPAALVDFYDESGKLHADHWPNADRFPFAAYATAALYLVTGSTSWVIGILVYNILAFVAFLVVLYAFTRAVWKDRYAALAAVSLALVHAYTFQFLYWKDGDMLLLATLAMWGLYRYATAPEAMTWRLALALGSVLAFVFLARPNLGVAFLLAFIVLAIRRAWRARGDGLQTVLRRLALREGLTIAVAFAWCVPFMVQSLLVWGKPLFSANNLYQLPLGTRFGMATDTWWKYTEPHHPVTLGRLLAEAPGQLASKFPSSWLATWKSVIGSYAVELVLAVGLVIVLRRQAGSDSERTRPIRTVAAIVLFALVANLALLPMYGYQDYSYRHYLGFGLPLLWLLAGRATVLLVERVRPAARATVEHVRKHAAMYVLGVSLAVLLVNVGAMSTGDTNRLFARVSTTLASHWLATTIAAILAITWRWIARPPWCPRLACMALAIVYSCYRPAIETKRADFAWFPANGRVWDVLRQHHGLVSSLALQGEVAWNTGRKNIPAPEWPMHIYSMMFDHKLEVEDVYIESAYDLISSIGGLGAAGFEGYARLQSYRTLPGYEVAYHEETTRGYPKFRIKPRPRASTVFHLVDRAAANAIAHSPDRVDLGDPSNVIYTAHGWSDYYTLEGKRVVAGTDATRSRYAGADEGPWEDAGITFFLDDRHPKSVDLDFYATHATTYTFYWNLDLYEWDRATDRAAHAIGTVTTTGAGWQHAHFEVAASLPRTGLNKLGFRARTLQTVVMCPHSMTDEACAAKVPVQAKKDEADSQAPTLVLRPEGETSPEVLWMTMLAGPLELHY